MKPFTVLCMITWARAFKFMRPSFLAPLCLNALLCVDAESIFIRAVSRDSKVIKQDTNISHI